VGKSVFAKLIHNKSRRRDKPFIEINCGAIPGNLLESELFGYESGSFTGANIKGKTGLIELAQGGTLFLDEVSELPLDLQVKVLSVVQNKNVLPVGGTESIHVDFRLIAASNKNLEKLVERGLFREDLYYRLKVIPIDIPPLKERREDIVHMCIFFMDKFNETYHLNKSLSYMVMEIFQKYEWPGNIRELENLIERLVLTSETDRIGVECLPEEMQHLEGRLDFSSEKHSLSEALEKLEGYLVRKAYDQCGTTVGVADILEISQPTAVRKIKKYVLGTIG
jgi:transcriptional regulator with PAS, ATPase and Fis domain